MYTHARAFQLLFELSPILSGGGSIGKLEADALSDEMEYFPLSLVEDSNPLPVKSCRYVHIRHLRTTCLSHAFFCVFH